jgi:para-nitrobenzyl esterase
MTLRRRLASSANHKVACLLSALAFASSAIAGSAVHAKSTQTDVIRLSDGGVQGIDRNGVAEFLGIPYAAPPVGDLRWRPPQSVSHWSTVLQAVKFANTCAQPQRGVFAAPSKTEDCLYLNVFTPQAKAGSAHKRPVMVWFHGGGLFSGESNDYDGSKLAKRGDVVVVTLNYRVGALGFFSHPAINAEGHPSINYGIMDQQFALKWVQRNIVAFGGDPKNVTIFGQSGGGTSVMANLASPKADGLFQRAIVESGTRIGVTPPSVTLKAGEDLAAAAGCTDQSAKCLRSLSVEQILNNQAGILKYVVDYPAVDGTIITKTAFESYSTGRFNRVPILTGVVQDEQAFFLPEIRTHKPLTADEYKAYADTFGAKHAETILNKYSLSKYPSPSLAEIGMAQGLKSCTARLLDRTWSKYVPVYGYEFRDHTAPSYFPAMSYPMKAYHTSELQYLFPLFHGGQGTPSPLSPAQEKLSDDMVDYWTSFARTGVPDRAGHRGLTPWPRYSTERDNVQALNLPEPKQSDSYGKANDCELWSPIVHELAVGTLR